MFKDTAAVLAFVAVAIVGCGTTSSGQSAIATVPSRLTPVPSSVRNVPGCNLLMAYDGATVFLNFVTAQTDCGTIQRDVAAIGPPFTSALTPVSSITLASPTLLCLKSNFSTGGVPLAKLLLVLVNRGDSNPAATAFCSAWMGTDAT